MPMLSLKLSVFDLVNWRPGATFCVENIALE